MAKTSIRIGIDTGGTFTDFAVVRNGAVTAIKMPSDPGNPAAPILAGLAALDLRGVPIEVIHGTTVATNALLQRRGARTAVLTTAGFEDLLEIGRQARPGLYRLHGDRPAPLVPRRHRLGLEERVLADGRIESPLRGAEVRAAFRALAASGIESVAVCFLHSYRNPIHEKTVARHAPPGLFLSLSHQISPEYREFERLATTVANAYLGPVLRPHLEGLRRSLGRVRLRVMISNGGSASIGRAADEAVRTVLSGPAGGVLGAERLGARIGEDRLIAFDMGGTSTDVSLIDGGVRHSTEAKVGGLPLRVPMIDIETVGAGGGSIARRDRGGALRVGPESAGADPGPVCYGRGDGLTVTDANLFLGRLAPEDFLGGAMPIDPARAAAAVLQVANANMERAIRRVSVARGLDPRRFTLLCYGGAAGLHACDLAVALGIRRILVPLHPGAFSAIGMLQSDAGKDYSRTVLSAVASAAPDRIEAMFRQMERRGAADLRREGFTPDRVRFLRSADLRYLGQSYELNLPVPAASRRRATDSWRRTLRAAFDRRHLRAYGYTRAEQPVELVNLRLQAIGVSAKPRFGRIGGNLRRRRRVVPDIRREVRHRGEKLNVPVYRRDRLRPGDRWKGPAVVSEYSSTLFVDPGFDLEVDPYGNLVLQR
jgi:N-methylhydantoinase A